MILPDTHKSRRMDILLDLTMKAYRAEGATRLHEFADEARCDKEGDECGDIRKNSRHYGHGHFLCTLVQVISPL